MGFSLESKGSFGRTETFLTRSARGNIATKLDEYGRQGVAALSSATPVGTGEAAMSWYYNIVHSVSGWSIEWRNDDMAGGVPTVILLQYGHGTGTGGYVQGRDFINPAIRPIMDKIAGDAWKVVTG